MDKRGDFIVSYDIMISIARIAVLILFVTFFTILLGSVTEKKVDVENIEAREFYLALKQCSLNNGVIDENKLNNIEKCGESERGGARLTNKDKEYFFNEEHFFNYRGLCGISFFCAEYNYFDKNQEQLKVEVVIKNE